MSKLKYKVGYKGWLEAKIIEVDENDLSSLNYLINCNGFNIWMTESEVDNLNYNNDTKFKVGDRVTVNVTGNTFIIIQASKRDAYTLQSVDGSIGTELFWGNDHLTLVK